MQKENIQRFKETILVICFLLFLFSFSNRSFATTNKAEKVPAKIETTAKIVYANLTTSPSFEAKHIPQILLHSFHVAFELKERCDSNASSLLISFLEMQFNTFKTRNPSAFYYLLFCLHGEIPG